MNSKCYKKFPSQQTWFSASNDCLNNAGSLAVFADTGRPSDNSQLNNWLNATGTDKSYWIGLVRSWWKTSDKGDFNSTYSCWIFVAWFRQFFCGVVYTIYCIFLKLGEHSKLPFCYVDDNLSWRRETAGRCVLFRSAGSGQLLHYKCIYC